MTVIPCIVRPALLVKHKVPVKKGVCPVFQIPYDLMGDLFSCQTCIIRAVFAVLDTVFAEQQLLLGKQLMRPPQGVKMIAAVPVKRHTVRTVPSGAAS